MEKRRYIVRPAAADTNSFNVIDTSRLNAWNEPYITHPLVSYYQAQAIAEALNHGRSPYSWIAEKVQAADF